MCMKCSKSICCRINRPAFEFGGRLSFFNPVIGSDIDRGIHTKAGHELLVARQKVGCIEFGDEVITRR